MEFLGHDINVHGASPLASKVQAIVDLPQPTTIKGLGNSWDVSRGKALQVFDSELLRMYIGRALQVVDRELLEIYLGVKHFGSLIRNSWGCN